jgi:hypothetical protein
MGLPSKLVFSAYVNRIGIISLPLVVLLVGGWPFNYMVLFASPLTLCDMDETSCTLLPDAAMSS